MWEDAVTTAHARSTMERLAQRLGALCRRPQRARSSGVASMTVLVMVASTLVSGPVFAAPNNWTAPRPKLSKSIAVTPIPAGAKRRSRTAAQSVSGAPKVAWPKAGKGTLSITAPTGGRHPSYAKSAGLPVSVAGVAANRTNKTAVEKAAVQVLGQSASRHALGGSGVVMSVARADSVKSAGKLTVRLDYSSFADAFGAGYGSRLRLVELPSCALTSPKDSKCRTRTALKSVNDSDASTLTATVSASPSGTVLAALAGASGATGDYSATPLSPSAAWQVSPQTGDFSWNYPLRVPPSVAGPAPQLSLTYDSQMVDGRTAATNNQSSWIGDGWDMWAGYVERSYKGCADDTGNGANNESGKTVGDSCWAFDNATLSLNGHATQLVKDGDTGKWHLASDDGSRVEHLTGADNGDNDGEYWRVTTSDGTQYLFGRNHIPGWSSGDADTNSTWTMPVFGNNSGEPCHATAYADSWCQQAWRWNLDYVVDPHGNAVSYSYTKETGYYGRDGDASLRTSFTRGGELAEATYGFTDGHAYDTKAPAKVVFGVSDRCAPNTTCDTDHPASWPDTPWDQDCLTAPCTDKTSPVFFTQKRLTTVTTQVLEGTSYQNVDRWTLDQSFLDTGDNDAKPLWLKSITHSGLNGGTATLPAVTFDGTQMANRVDTSTDGLSALNRYRITSITSESGGTITIGYSAPQCVAGSTMPSSPDNDTLRCMPTYWYPPGETKKLDYFHKYVVTEVRSHDPFGGSSVDEDTFYDYEGSPAWHYDDNPLVPSKSRTWSQWRGYQKVLVRHGAANGTESATRYLYLRGMDGDHQSDGTTRSVTVTDSQGGTITDSDQLQGFQREQIGYEGNGGQVLQDTINDPWTHGPTATQSADGATSKAWMLDTGTATTRSLLADGSWGVKKTSTTFNNDGLPTQVDDQGDTSTATDDQCVRTTYATRNTTDWILNRASEVETDATRCSATPQPADVISHTRTYYDKGALGDAVTKGDITKTDALTSWNGSTPVYSTSTTNTYDSVGRALTTSDALGRTTSTSFTPSSGGPVTATAATDPAGDATTTTLDPASGQTLATVDANGHRTDVTYDPLGRLSAAWLPGRTKGTDDANIKYAYQIRNDAVSVVTTQSLAYKTSTATTGYVTSYALYDGLMRLRQTQSPAPGGGRMISDTVYNARGLKSEVTEPYHNDQAPSTTLVGYDQRSGEVAATDYVYDGSERQTAAIFMVGTAERWRTTTAYPGADRTDVTPPAGGTATSTLTDSRGHVTELRQYHAATPTGAYDATKYTYTSAGQQATVTDPAGNIWKYTYDTRGYKVKSEDPDTGTSTSTYDNAGQVTSTTDARGTTLAYSYDDLGRQTGEYLNTTGGLQLAGWEYDTLPGGKGQLTSSTRYDGSDAYTTAVKGYDSVGRPTGTVVTIPSSQGALAGTYTDSYSYNPDGTLASTTVPAAGGLKAEKLSILDDEQGKPVSMSSALGTYALDAVYDHDGSLSQLVLGTYGSRVYQDYSYDPAHRLTKADAVDENKGYSSNIGYTYDPAGNVTAATDNPDGNPDTQCFRFDYQDRITDAWTPKSTGTDGSTPGSCDALPTTTSDLGGPAAYWHTYDYDLTGNRTQLVEHIAGGDTTISSTYPQPGAAQPHTLQSTTTTTSVAAGSTATELSSYTYDNAGDTTTRTVGGNTQTLAWTNEGKLGSLKNGDNTTSYTYDADGSQLIRHDQDGSATLVSAGWHRAACWFR